ncbi:hypothetical protein MW887_007648 [Aspergillus wentii]|nr:hypothetical protein MW887_007648 [Aspergillus wentii]
MLEILQTTINRDFDGKMQVEGGFDGPLMRWVARHVCRKNTESGCGNILGLRAELSAILERARRRLAQDKNGTCQIDPYFLSQDDLSGPDTEDRLVKSTAWEKLQRMVGLEDVKERVRRLHHLLRDNFERDDQGQLLLPINLNGVFLGLPGTGKTTVAKLYGQILVDLGLLSEGKDNAHMLWMGSKDKVDSFRYGIIDTIFGCVPGNGRANQCVLLIGYKNEMEEMFRNVNPGLSRRFQLSSAFHFQPYSITALERILTLKLEEYHVSASYDARLAASMLFRHAITSPQFGNAAYVEEVIQSAQVSLAERYLSNSSIDRNQLEAQDFPTDWDRALNAEEECQRLFEGVVGCNPIISQLLEDTKVARNCFLRNIDARDYIPFHYIFKGPPGTGKTTTARKMGRIFYHMGILSSTEVVECPVTDMIGSYVGQTGPKTLALFEKAVGKVLFIDEAYRLYDQSASGREFATDAIGELVGALTSARFQNSLVIILAGHGPGMEALLSSNPGLRSRFKRIMTFENMDGVACTQLLINTLRQHGVDTAPLETPSCEAAQRFTIY